MISSLQKVGTQLIDEKVCCQVKILNGGRASFDISGTDITRF